MILDFDPSLQKVQEYLNSVKEPLLACCASEEPWPVSKFQDFLRDRRALDLLYSYEAGMLSIKLLRASATKRRTACE